MANSRRLLRIFSCCCFFEPYFLFAINSVTLHVAFFSLSVVLPLRQVVYYVAVDRPTKSLVIAVRGTLSFQDIVTDVQAFTHRMDQYGYVSEHTGRQRHFSS